MNKKKTKYKRELFKAATPEDMETEANGYITRRLSLYNYVATFGRASAHADCPFCHKSRIKVYVWSLAGSGKRCPNCNALLAHGRAFVDMEVC